MKDIKRTPELREALDKSLAHWRENEGLLVKDAHTGADYCAMCVWAEKESGVFYGRCVVCPLTSTKSVVSSIHCCDGLFLSAAKCVERRSSDWPAAAKAVADFIEKTRDELFLPTDNIQVSKNANGEISQIMVNGIAFFPTETAMQSAKKAGRTEIESDLHSNLSARYTDNQQCGSNVTITLNQTAAVFVKSRARQFAMELLGLTIEDEGK
jgi:hypothetical protein